jgi:UPF0755 protein
MKKIVFSLIIIVFVMTTGAAWFMWDHFANKKNSGSHEEVLFEVHQGESFIQVVKELEKAGLIRDAQMFSLYSKIKGEAGKMKVGEYAIQGDLLPSEVLAIINSGKSIGRSLTIPEGMNIFEISEMWEEEGFGSKEEIMALARDKAFVHAQLDEDLDSLEGYLFPETYQLTKFTDAKKFLTMMVRKFNSVWAEISPHAKAMGWTRNQVVTLASIIEKETGAPEERPMISSVFHNRLEKGMMLQTDPTVLYGKAEVLGKMILNITRADLTTPTRYNTYTIKGLPPGPIANPSKEALLAATEPAVTEYLYFVSKNQGTHTFSKDYKAHLEAVKKFQMDPKAREGKSWRDLKKLRQSAAPAK